MNREADPFLFKPVHEAAPKPGLESASGCMGAAVAHESAVLHVAGEAAYIDDLPEWTGTLHAALGLAPVASGRLVAIDVDGLKKLYGSVAILTAADIPGVNDCGAIVDDEPIFADGEVRYLGQPNVDDTTLRRLKRKLRDADVKSFKKDMAFAPAWIADILRQLTKTA